MAQAFVSPVVLVILDGWGYCQSSLGNAIAAAKTPVMTSLTEVYPHTLIRAAGRDVGLPDGQMGNSEVGHLNLGAGRVVSQELVRISEAVEDGSLLQNTELVALCGTVNKNQSKLHLIGLCSDGGVHSHVTHLLGLLDLAQAQGIDQVCIHLITDGRDTKPTDAAVTIAQIEAKIAAIGLGKIVTIAGRYYAMDRDNRWDRVQLAYDVMTQSDDGNGQSALEALKSSYAAGLTDEFVLPLRLAPGSIEPGDGVIFYNYRPDRARELTSALISPDFKGFDRPQIQPLAAVTFTQYDETLPVAVAFKPQTYPNILGEVIANQGLRQFRTAETEKYPHVTYFFNGGEEKPYPGEEHLLIPSPNVSTYDKTPAMSASTLTDGVMKAIEQGIYSLIVINYANPDMVGHTGKLGATIEAIEAVDRQIGRLLGSITKMGGTTIITADHGNAETMLDEDGNPWTAHTSNLVPLILVEGEVRKIPGHGTDITLREDGRLADVAPTILEILQITQPTEMTGQSLIVPVDLTIKANRTPVHLGR